MKRTYREFLSQKSFKNLLAFIAGPVLSAVLSILLVPIITHLVIPQEVGKASMYNLFFSFSLLLTLGAIDQAFAREFYSTKDKSYLIWNSYLVSLFFFVIFAFIFFNWRYSIILFLFNDFSKNIFIILLSSIFWGVIHRFNLLAVRFRERGKEYLILLVLRQIFRIILIPLFIVIFKRGYLGIIYGEYAALLLITIFSFVFVKHIWKFSPIRRMDRTLILKLLRYSMPLFPATLLFWSMQWVDRFSLRIWSGFEELGLYFASYKVANIINIVYLGLTAYWIPVAYRWYEQKKPAKYYVSSLNIVFLIMTLLATLVISFRNFIVYILGENYYASSQIVPYLVLMPVFLSFAEVGGIGINLSRKTFLQSIITFVVIILNLGGNYLLVPIYGAKGAAISTAFSYTVFFILRYHVSENVVKLYNSAIKTFIYILILWSLPLFTNIPSSLVQYIFYSVVVTFLFIYNYRFLKNFLQTLQE